MEFQLYYTEQGQGLPLYCYTETEKVRIIFSSNRTFLQDISCDCC